MKIIFSLFFAVFALLVGTADAQYTRTQLKNRLVDLHMESSLATEIAKAITGNAILANNVPLIAKTSGGTSVEWFKINTSDDNIYNADSGDLHTFAVAGTSEFSFANDTFYRHGTDTASLQFAGTTGSYTVAGGAANSAASGSRVIVNGATNATAGDLSLSTASVNGSELFVDLNHSSGNFVVRNSSAANLLYADHSGNLTFDATNGGNLILSHAQKSALLGTTTASGDVGGGGAGQAPLYAVANTSNRANAGFIGNGASQNGPILTFYKTRTSDTTADTIVNSADDAGTIVFAAADGASYRDVAKILAEVDNTPGSSDMPGALYIQTTPDGSATLSTVVKFGNDQSSAFTGTITSSATGALGWAVVDGADNTACNSICTSAAVIGFDGTTPVGPAAATADICVCAGAS